MDKDPYFFKGLGSQTKLKNLVTQYSHKLPSILEDLHQKILSLSQSAFNESQWEEVNRQVHNLKGVSGTYGFSSISQNSALIESALLKKDFTNALAIIKSMMTMQPVINENRELPLFTKKNIKPEHIFLLDDDKNFIDYISTVLSTEGSPHNFPKAQPYLNRF
ncbi:Hpt domain-containing protein [Vibrio metschnikovii]|uniref:Hpt domain-containing protein n=1 Tax=Vibrio metschnikovii TaxID=28172 RepID=UPI001C30215E|nr:Hpt domain-containing protein [Vibrio metschnikovii]